jgi:hypothetical protein
MYSWSLRSQVKYCLQGDALYISLPNYLSQKPVFSFLCKNNYEEHLENFVEWLKYNSLPIRFDLVPRDVAIEVQKILNRRGSVYKMEENRDNFDYILDVNKIAQAGGGEYEDFRYKISKFSKTWGNKITRINFDPNKKEHVTQAMNLAQEWVERKTDKTLYNDEIYAFHRFLFAAKHLPSLNFTSYTDNYRMIAFAATETLKDDYAMGHFIKFNPSYESIYYKLVHETCLSLSKSNVKYINIEQDLGIPGLRQTKMHLRPQRFLKKYYLEITNLN